MIATLHLISDSQFLNNKSEIFEMIGNNDCLLLAGDAVQCHNIANKLSAAVFCYEADVKARGLQKQIQCKTVDLQQLTQLMIECNKQVAW